MATLGTITIPPIDPLLYTGPVRATAGVITTVAPTLDAPYGSGGNPLYMRWLYAGTTGDVSYVKWDGTSQTLVGLAAGVWHPIHSLQINTTGTTATNLVVGC